MLLNIYLYLIIIYLCILFLTLTNNTLAAESNSEQVEQNINTEYVKICEETKRSENCEQVCVSSISSQNSKIPYGKSVFHGTIFSLYSSEHRDIFNPNF